MKIEHKTQNGMLWFVKVPDDANCFTIEYGRLCFNDGENMPDYYVLNKYGLTPEKGQEDYDFWEFATKHQEEQNRIDKFKLIGPTSEVTEELAKIIGFDYVYDGRDDENIKILIYECFDDSDFICHNALDSFKSLMLHLQVYEVNPISPDLHDVEGLNYDAWKANQSMVGKWIVLFKSNGKL